MDILIYRNYQGTIEYSSTDNTFFGKIKDIKDLITYEAQTIEELEEKFREAVDSYLN